MAGDLMGAGIKDTVGDKVLNDHFGKGVVVSTAEQRSEMPLDSIPYPFCQLCARAQSWQNGYGMLSRGISLRCSAVLTTTPLPK